MPARRIAATTAAAAGRPITGRMDWAGPQPAAPRRATDWDADKSILVVLLPQVCRFSACCESGKGCEWQQQSGKDHVLRTLRQCGTPGLDPACPLPLESITGRPDPLQNAKCTSRTG